VHLLFFISIQNSQIKTRSKHLGNLEDLKQKIKKHEEEAKEQQRKADEELKQWQLRQRSLKK
jgi:proteasome assembly chaperone (PAC2) family protein